MIEVTNKGGLETDPASAVDAASSTVFSQLLASESQQAFARFGADLVHEINGPLAVAMLNTQLALRSIDATADPKAKRLLERAVSTIQDAANAIRSVVRRYCESNTHECRFDVRDVLRFTVAVMKEHCERSGCQLIWHRANEDSYAIGNPVELELALSTFIYGIVADGARRIEISSRVVDQKTHVQVAYDRTTLSEEITGELMIRDLICDAGGMLSRPVESIDRQEIIISLPK